MEYLPTISLADHRCVGAESLIRWQRGNEVIYPLEFIPQIENTPISGILTYWVMNRVAQELRQWLMETDQSDVHLSINVPPEVFGRGGIHYAAKTSHLDDVADKLIFEVTERGLLDPMGIEALNIAQARVQIALDDVSLNDANLFVLSRTPVDIVKLDKSFSDQIHQPDWSHRKIAGISALIRNGDLRVIAEGIETAEQVEVLTEAGIQWGQGWYFSPSLSASDFMTYFSERNSDKPH